MSRNTRPTGIVGVCNRLSARPRRRPPITARSTRLGSPSPRAAISIRWTIRSTTVPTRTEITSAASPLLACTLSSFSRRSATSIAHGSLWMGTIPMGRSWVSPRAPTAQALMRSCSRPTGRTTWFPLGAIAPSRLPSFSPDRGADGILAGTNELTQVDHTFRAVEQGWQEAGRTGKPHLVAQIDIALERNGEEEGHKHVLDYYATLPAFAASTSAMLLTTERQLLDTMHLLEQIGADELVFFTWSTAIEQVDQIADLFGASASQ